MITSAQIGLVCKTVYKPLIGMLLSKVHPLTVLLAHFLIQLCALSCNLYPTKPARASRAAIRGSRNSALMQSASNGQPQALLVLPRPVTCVPRSCSKFTTISLSRHGGNFLNLRMLKKSGGHLRSAFNCKAKLFCGSSLEAARWNVGIV